MQVPDLVPDIGIDGAMDDPWIRIDGIHKERRGSTEQR